MGTADWPNLHNGNRMLHRGRSATARLPWRYTWHFYRFIPPLNDPMTNPENYRSDINGLRAWAVVAVVLYHFNLLGLSGGFAGVDIFFVISGFLMTSIVVAGIEGGRPVAGFIWSFYWARARRIIPALLVLCTVLLVLGWFLLISVDYRMLSSHAVSSLAFLSNVKYWTEAGYFDAGSHEKWLLHTWSLSVEWQFYLLFPLVLFAVWKCWPGRRNLMIFMVVGVAASLLLSIVSTQRAPSFAFYLLPTRAWEMLAGGAVFLLGAVQWLAPRARRWMESAGYLLILGCVFLFDASAPWPGWRALVPVAGTVLVLLAARSGSAWSGNAAAQWLGTRSYSLYLWHWPVFVALVYLELDGDTRALVAGLVLALLFAQLSYHYVEVRTRRTFGQWRPVKGGAVLVVAMFAVALPGLGIWAKQGVATRFPAQTSLAAAEATNVNPRQSACFTKTGTRSPSCIYGGAQLRAVLLGDSHADAITTALAAALPDASGGIMDWTYMSCPTLLGVKNLSAKYGPREQCGAFLDWAASRLDVMPADVALVIVNRTTMYALGHNEPGEDDTNRPAIYFSQPHVLADPVFLKEFSERLQATACHFAKRRRVYLVRPFPEMGVHVPKAMSRAMVVGGSRSVSIPLAAYHDRHRAIWAAQDAAHARCGVQILDPLPYLCRDGKCFGDVDGRPIYYDDDHLSEFGNKLLVPMFREVFAPSPQVTTRGAGLVSGSD